MNKLVIILTTLTVVATSSCKSKKEATIENKVVTAEVEANTADSNKSEPLEVKKIIIEDAKSADLNIDKKNDNIYSMVVSFFSRGSGIDFKIAREFDSYIKKFEADNSDNFIYEIVTWGREGEVDYCIQFPSLNKEKAKTFVNNCNEILSRTEMAHIKLDAECKRKR